MTDVHTNEVGRTRSRKWSRISGLARGAAIAQCNRERAERSRRGVRWSASEMKIVIDTYPDYRLMQERLPHRSLVQLKRFAYGYGIAKKRHVWTSPEIATLKRASHERWSKKRLCEALPHLTPDQIQAQFTHHGFRFRHGPKTLGIPILDEIRIRAFQMNLSLVDLDGICGRGKYWQRCERKPDWRRIEKVLEYVGGHLRVEFGPLADA